MSDGFSAIGGHEFVCI